MPDEPRRCTGGHASFSPTSLGSTSGWPRPTPRSPRCYPGDRGRRQPVHTVYVPADRFTPDLAARVGRAGPGRARARTAAPRRRWPTAIGADPAEVAAVYARVRRQARARADRGPADRLRGRLRPPARRRGGRRRRRRRPRPGRGRRRRDGAAVLRDPVQVLRGADPAPRPAHPRPVRRRAGRDRRPARRLRAHPAQGDVGRPGRGDGRWSASGWRTAHGLAAGAAAVRDPGRDAAGDPRRRTARRPSPG